MGIFGNLTSDGLEESQDRLGGFQVFESGIYTGMIKAAYAGKAASSNAQNVTVILALEGGKEYRETFWITNKAGENFFRNKQDEKKKLPLPGFTIIDDLCLVTTNKALADQTAEDKVMNIYDPEAKKEMPKSVPMLTELLGKQVSFGVLKQIVFKQEKNGAGDYVDTAESREENVTDKVFHHPSNLTVPEARKASADSPAEPAFHKAWLEKNKGVTRDRRGKGNGASTNGQSGRTGRPGAPPQAADAGTKRTSSLFGN